jgi:hypothetical protein
MTEAPQIGDDAFTADLWAYIASVAAQLGVGLESCCLDTDEPATVYLALDDRLAEFPDRDVALLWNAKTGWSVAVETATGEDLLVVAALKAGVLPEPAVVARFVTEVGRARPARRHLQHL